MQPVRDAVHVARYLGCPSPQIVERRRERVGRMHVELLQLDREQRQLLAQVIVQLPRNAPALLLLRDDQPSAEVGQPLLGFLVFGDVEAPADEAVERAVGAITRDCRSRAAIGYSPS